MKFRQINFLNIKINKQDVGSRTIMGRTVQKGNHVVIKRNMGLQQFGDGTGNFFSRFNLDDSDVIDNNVAGGVKGGFKPNSNY
ncbi:hypothetical protein [Ammoniphilus sp. CFH 90114]|uniref:hypothetical protein n=1 Tax=Ammoniphilus sp. CFH 90114 TaxID=2493665 RepID=UPI00100FA8AD|nr:hypothetical protein [Ammoniphilus sp. CFH 90114]RXT04827.1 hypothetical protein EIZ39_19055 [Ammoniphilus sp. CFH 90114]